MSRAQSIADMILSGERYANSRLFDDKVYEDEPIIQTGARAYGKHTIAKKRPTSIPKEYRELRRLARDMKGGSTSRYYGIENAKLFVAQAKLIEGFEDSYRGLPEPYGHWGIVPTYESLSNRDLRCYVTWRTRFRAHEDSGAPIRFILLHAYELFCGIGTEPGLDGLAQIRRLAELARGTFAEPYFRRWQWDYVVYYGLDASLLDMPTNAGFEAVQTLREAEKAMLKGTTPPDAGVLLDALVTLSRYRADRSLLFRRRRDDVAWVVFHVFADMVAHCDKRRKTGFVDGLFGAQVRELYTMFIQAPFWSETPHQDVTYEVSPGETIVCEQGFWWRSLPARRCDRNKELGALLHAIDARMRRALGVKHELKDKPLPKYQGRFVDARIAELVALREAEEAARITIDRTALGSIRSASARTREALLTDEEREDEKAVESPAPVTHRAPETHEINEPSASSASVDRSGLALDKDQLALLQDLLDGTGVHQTNSMAVSLAVDAINEAFLDIVGDTVVDFDGDVPVLVEDYLPDVRAML